MTVFNQVLSKTITLNAIFMQKNTPKSCGVGLSPPPLMDNVHSFVTFLIETLCKRIQAFIYLPGILNQPLCVL